MVNIGIIGAGRIGKVHAQTLVTSVPDATVLSVVDHYPEAAQALADTLNIPYASGEYTDILNQADLEAVVIASSTDTHAPFITEAAQAGKHIFCEKPIDFDLGRIDGALQAVERAGVKLQIGFNRRFDPSYARVRQAIVSGEIGVPHLLHIISRDPAPPPIEYIKVSGGLFFDMTIHDFDMARFLYGEVDEVYAVGGVMVDPAIGEAGDIDTAMITLKFVNGAVGVIDNSRQAVYGYDQRVEAFGSAGAASTANLYPDAVTIRTSEHVARGLPLNFFMERYTPSYIAEMQAFVDCVVNDTPPLVTGIDGRMPVVIGMAAMKSMAENRPVKLSEIEG